MSRASDTRRAWIEPATLGSREAPKPGYPEPRSTSGRSARGKQASAATKRLLPEGVRVRLLPEPATDRIDDFGRLLRYVVRVGDGVNVNVGVSDGV